MTEFLPPGNMNSPITPPSPLAPAVEQPISAEPPKNAPCCYACKRPYTEAEFAERKRIAKENQYQAIAAARALGEQIGRKREFSYERVAEMTRSGNSVAEIIRELGISRASVFRARKLTGTSRKKPSGEGV